MDEARTTVRMPRDLHKKLRVMAAMREKSINELIIELVRKEVDALGLDRLMAETEEHSE